MLGRGSVWAPDVCGRKPLALASVIRSHARQDAGARVKGSGRTADGQGPAGAPELRPISSARPRPTLTSGKRKRSDSQEEMLHPELHASWEGRGRAGQVRGQVPRSVLSLLLGDKP